MAGGVQAAGGEKQNALPSGLPADLIHKICIENPLETYPRLSQDRALNSATK